MKKILVLLFTIFISLYTYSQKIKEFSRDWTSFSQSVTVATDTLKRFKVVAYVKLITEDDNAWAGVWARVDNKPNQGRGFFDNMSKRPIKSNEWAEYTLEGTIDQKSERLVFGGICTRNGKFYFDKFEVFIEDDNGKFDQVTIENPSFEDEIVNNIIPAWNPGIKKGEINLVREFKFSTTEDSVEGNYAVLIEGKGISSNIGSSEAALPYIGYFIGTVYLLIIVFVLITYFSSTENKNWSLLSRIGFRFSFIYFLLFIIFQNNGAYPLFQLISQFSDKVMQKLAIWFGESLIRVPYQIKTGPNGSGDTTYDYMVIFVVFTIAILGTIVWSIIDKKRTSYKNLYYVLTTAIRYYVGLMLISYGLVKVIQLQFAAPRFDRLMQSYGESSPMGLAWTFLGFSEGYNLFMGIAEVLAGLLLFRRTMTLGAIITLMTAMNVMAVNYFYDVPVKILSTHLVLMTLFLLARDFKKVMSFFVTHSPVQKLTLIQMPKFGKPMRIGLKIFKGLVLVYALGYGFYSVLKSRTLYGTLAPKPPLYGVYEVTNYVINGDTITNYKSDKLWKNLTFERANRVRIQKINREENYYKVEVDTIQRNIRFFPSGNAVDFFDLKYANEGKSLDFHYIYKNDTISGETRRLDKEDFLLTNRGFHWINEYPYNR
ncbi:hypothetical protein [Aquimarina brevivitae]|uniref:DoxX-like protein n=1 Tax=Aquimarina brevivitae TaxID=323412 RepID=A0A4Q7PH78_9FLAO|nr:hypothetical protein [Aquimarina brevivitae]RZS99130.1 hypothetical protein EV197_0337 [Aquimarina brevivitae]